MGDNEIIVNKELKLVYCDNIIKDNDRTYKALADQIKRRYFFNLTLYDIFPIKLIYNERHIIVAEYEFIYYKPHGMKLRIIYANQIANDSILYKEGNYIVPDRNTISEELALEMYNKFKEVFGCK